MMQYIFASVFELKLNGWFDIKAFFGCGR